MNTTITSTATSSTRNPTSGLAPSRLISLDVLRGITIVFMIYDGQHALWNGWTPIDIVFPTFLFVMGTSLAFSFDSRLRRGVSKSTMVPKILRRSLILFALGIVVNIFGRGIIVNSFPFFLFHLHTLRIYGVLQRIALCYLIVGILYLWVRRPMALAGITAITLVGYWALVRWVPVPGFGLPGRDVPFMDPHGNIVAYVDRLLLSGRLFDRYRDPEGLLSTLPALGTTLLGVLTGLWLSSKRTLQQQKCWGLFFGGVLGLLLGELWNHWLPINKNMWTSSFVLFAAGWSLVAFAFCYWAVEIKGWRRGWTYFWLVFGMNAITAYVFSELLGALRFLGSNGRPINMYSFHDWMFDWASPGLGSLLYSLFYILVCFVPVAILYHKKIFMKV